MAKKSYIGQEVLIKYLKEKRGISKFLSNLIIKDIIDFVICSLCLYDKIGISDLGTFTVIPNEYYGARIKYRPSKKLKSAVQDYKLKNQGAVGEADVDDLITFSEADDSPAENIEADFNTEDIGRKDGTKGNVIRKSFLDYLKKEFCHGEDWKHPISNQYYSFDLIKETLKEYKKGYPENYSLLWALWTTQKTRVILAEQYKLSPSSVQRRWYDAIDCILLMLQFPELEPDIPLNLYDGV